MRNQETYRALLTEVLPYEIHLRMSNESFYRNMLKEEGYNFYLKCVGQIEDYTIPFNYQVRKYGGESSRKLSIIHPSMQIELARFYQRYSEIMLYSCKLSPFSLRHIDAIAHQSYLDDLKNMKADPAKMDENIINLDNYKSFFTYKDVDIANKFYEGFGLIRLEQKFKYMRKLDVSKCFYNIYSHSITWAVKGKAEGKKNASKGSFENRFDKLMQQANYNETNGIVVGPEFSRIFAEIIFQRIDKSVIILLKEEKKLKLGVDYEVRRYVDDYMVFSNDENTLDIVETIISEILSEYKLYLNESKRATINRPLMTLETKAKIETKVLFEDFISKYFIATENNKYININRPNTVYLNLCHAFTAIALDNNVKYGNINRIILDNIKNFLKKDIASKISKNHLLIVNEFAFYVYSLDMCASAAIKLSSIIYNIARLANETGDMDIIYEVKEATIRQLKQLVDVDLHTRKGKETNLEIQNILTAVFDVWNFILPENVLLDCFNIGSEIKELDYFQICTLIYLSRNEKSSKKVISYAINRIKDNSIEAAKKDAERTILFLDMLSCPYINDEKKKELIKAYTCESNDNTINDLLNDSKQFKRWFFDWDGKHEINEIIKKKEYRFAYE